MISNILETQTQKISEIKKKQIEMSINNYN